MKRIAVLLVLCFAVGLLATVQAAPTSHDMKAEIVSIDMTANTLTVKDDKGATKTVPVLEAARGSMANFKAGDKVTLSCMDDDQGAHKGVSAIKATAPVAKAS